MSFIVDGLTQTQVRRIGEYETKAEAITVAHRTIKEFLLREFKPGMDGQVLLAQYQEQGEHPYIFRDDGDTLNVPGYNHALYAMICAAEICGEKA